MGAIQRAELSPAVVEQKAMDIALKAVRIKLNRLVLAADAKGYQRDRPEVEDEDRFTDADIDAVEADVIAAVEECARLALQAEDDDSALGHLIEARGGSRYGPEGVRPQPRRATLVLPMNPIAETGDRTMSERLCTRCKHPDDWHRHDDVACLSTHPQPCSLAGTLEAHRGAPLAPFRCHGYDVDGAGWPGGTPESRCGCPDFIAPQEPR